MGLEYLPYFQLLSRNNHNIRGVQIKHTAANLHDLTGSHLIEPYAVEILIRWVVAGHSLRIKTTIGVYWVAPATRGDFLIEQLFLTFSPSVGRACPVKRGIWKEKWQRTQHETPVRICYIKWSQARSALSSSCCELDRAGLSNVAV